MKKIYKIKKFIALSKEEKRILFLPYYYGKLFRRRFGNFGKKSYIDKPIIISNPQYISIGNHVGIWKNARIECIDVWKGQRLNPEIIIGDGCMFGQGLHMAAGSKIVIENNVVISSYVLISTIAHSYNVVDIHPLYASLECKDIYIGNNTLIGAGVKIMPGVRIGKGCVIGANAVVTREIPDYCIAVGIPATITKKYNHETNAWEDIKDDCMI